MTTRLLTFLNESGDNTIEWEPESDAYMLDFIQKKMDAGVTFYIVAKRKPGQRGRVAGPKKLTDPGEALKHRSLSIKDQDLSKLVLEGKGRMVPSPTEEAQTVRRAKTAKEVVSAHSVAVQPRRGG